MESFVLKISNSKFMQKLEEISMKMSGSKIFSTISSGMGGTMGLIMIGAIVQIVLALATNFFGMDTESAAYIKINTIYQSTMGIMSIFMAFNMAHGFAKKNDINPVQAGFTAIMCFILVAAPVHSIVDADGVAHMVIDTSNLSSGGIFTALIIGLASVRISKFAIDHNWMIKLPDVVPEGILHSFNSIIPTGINIVIWYGLALIVDAVSGGALSIPTIVIWVLSIPIGLLLSTPGMFIIMLLAQTFWFFGIHGSSVVWSVMFAPMMAAYMTNAELALAGQPLQYNPAFLYLMSMGILGGAGNTLPLLLMGIKSKSKTIKTISRAALPTAFFNINEPVIFGFPIMYNAIFLIPFMLCPVVVGLFLLLGWNLGLLAYPQVLVLTTLPIIVSEFIATLDWRNAVFVVLMFPVCWMIWYPFFKVYEKQCVANEQAEAIETADAG